jgi:hypothetical protein
MEWVTLRWPSGGTAVEADPFSAELMEGNNEVRAASRTCSSCFPRLNACLLLYDLLAELIRLGSKLVELLENRV